MTTPDDPVHRTLAAQVDELRAWDRAVRADDDDAVHQLRVTIRKIRSLLQAAEQTLGAPDVDDIITDLRWLAGVLGAARDAEVLAERYQAALGRLPRHLVRGRVRERLVDAARRRYQEGYRQSLTAMDSSRYADLVDRLDALAADVRAPGGETSSPADAVGAAAAAGAVDAAVEAAYRKVGKAARAAERATDAVERDQALHRLRKAAKRLRYTAVATGAAATAECAKTIQTLLGDHQDSVVSRVHLAAEAAEARAAGEDAFTYDLLYRQEEDVAGECRARLPEALERLRDVHDAGRR